MVNLKQDLLNNLGNEKYYEEKELARLVHDSNISYKEKIEKMIKILKNIQSIDFAIQLVGKYFQENEPQANVPMKNNPVQQQPQTKPHAGQTHGE